MFVKFNKSHYLYFTHLSTFFFWEEFRRLHRRSKRGHGTEMRKNPGIRDYHKNHCAFSWYRSPQKSLTVLLCFSVAVRVELYSSFSPCKECCTLIERFIQQRSHCKVHIAFTCVYRTYDDRHASALRKLNDLGNVLLLDIFTVKEWQLLLDRNLIYLTPMGLRGTEIWDAYWREELKKIITIIPEKPLENLQS